MDNRNVTSNISVNNNSMMIESVKCSLCNLEFKTIDQMLGCWRLEHHQNVEHLAECIKCERKFTSYSNATVHLYLTHDVRCVNCGDCCDSRTESGQGVGHCKKTHWFSDLCYLSYLSSKIR